MTLRMPSATTLKAGSALGLMGVAVFTFAAPLLRGADRKPTPTAPVAATVVQAAPLSVLESSSLMAQAMLARMDERANTATVQTDQPLMRAATTLAAAMDANLEDWFKGMVETHMPTVKGCNDDQRFAAFVAMLTPTDPTDDTQAHVVQGLRDIATNGSPNFNAPRAVMKFYQDILMQLDAHPCTQAPVAAQPNPPQSTQPTPVIPAQAGMVLMPAQAEAAPVAEQQTDMPVQPAPQPTPRKRREDTPTLCLGLSTVLCDGGISEAPTAEEETLPWADRS